MAARGAFLRTKARLRTANQQHPRGWLESLAHTAGRRPKGKHREHYERNRLDAHPLRPCPPSTHPHHPHPAATQPHTPKGSLTHMTRPIVRTVFIGGALIASIGLAACTGAADTPVKTADPKPAAAAPAPTPEAEADTAGRIRAGADHRQRPSRAAAPSRSQRPPPGPHLPCDPDPGPRRLDNRPAQRDRRHQRAPAPTTATHPTVRTSPRTWSAPTGWSPPPGSVPTAVVVVKETKGRSRGREH